MVETHMEIVKALRSRDGQLAKDLSMEEIDRSLKSIEESLAVSALGGDAKGGDLPIAAMK
jgi:DNA-binding GntR family transcriptional regulator